MSIEPKSFLDSIETIQTQKDSVTTALDSIGTTKPPIVNHVNKVNDKAIEGALTTDYYQRLKALEIQKGLISSHINVINELDAKFQNDLEVMRTNLKLYEKYSATGDDAIADGKYAEAEAAYYNWYGLKVGGGKSIGYTVFGEVPGSIAGSKNNQALWEAGYNLHEGHLANVRDYNDIYRSFLTNLSIDTSQHEVEEYHKIYSYKYDTVVGHYEPALYNNAGELIRGAQPVPSIFTPTTYHITPASEHNIEDKIWDNPNAFYFQGDSEPDWHDRRVGEIVLGSDGGYHIVTPTMFNVHLQEIFGKNPMKTYKIVTYGGTTPEGGVYHKLSRPDEASGFFWSENWRPNDQHLLLQTKFFAEEIAQFNAGYLANVNSFMNEFNIAPDSDLGKSLLEGVPQFNAGDYDYEGVMDDHWYQITD